MRYKECLSIRGNFLYLLVELMLVNSSVLSDHVLWLTQRWDVLLFFLSRRRLWVWGCTLGDSLSGQNLEGTYGGIDIKKSGILCCHEKSSSPSLRMSGSCDLTSGYFTQGYPWWLRRRLDGELRRGEAIVHPVGSEWALWGCENDFFLKAPPRPWMLMEGSPYCGFSFVLSSPWLKDGLVDLFIASSN